MIDTIAVPGHTGQLAQDRFGMFVDGRISHDANLWADAAADAGMEYLVTTDPLATDGGQMMRLGQGQPREWVRCSSGTRVACEVRQAYSVHAVECSSRSAGDLVRALINAVSQGGGLLLRVFPNGRGEMDAPVAERLRAIGMWMHHHSRSIYGCTAAPAEIPVPADCRFTYNPEKKRLYAHLFSYPYKFLNLDGLAGEVQYAQFLHDGSEVVSNTASWMASYAGEADGQNVLRLQIPSPGPRVTIPVIEMFLK